MYEINFTDEDLKSAEDQVVFLHGQIKLAIENLEKLKTECSVFEGVVQFMKNNSNPKTPLVKSSRNNRKVNSSNE